MTEVTTKALRTPEDRFTNLPGYPFASHYLFDLPGYADLRMHYLDESALKSDSTELFLCLHGQPTWSYLYRKMIPIFAEHGRVIVPDLYGFGKSDKPVNDDTYTFDFHRDSLLRFVEKLDLKNITLVCQDWGGVLGLTLPVDMPERFTRLVIMNTAFGTGDVPLGEGFLQWRAYNNSQPDMNIPALMGRATPTLTEEERNAYGAPYPDINFKAGVRRFPNLVPDHPQAGGAEVSRKARDWWRTQWRGKSFMAIGMKDPVLGPPVMRAMHKLIKNCPPPLEIPEAGHFVQEWGHIVAQAGIESFSKS